MGSCSILSWPVRPLASCIERIVQALLLMQSLGPALTAELPLSLLTLINVKCIQHKWVAILEKLGRVDSFDGLLTVTITVCQLCFITFLSFCTSFLFSSFDDKSLTAPANQAPARPGGGCARCTGRVWWWNFFAPEPLLSQVGPPAPGPLLYLDLKFIFKLS